LSSRGRHDLVIGAEHDVVGKELRAAVEELSERLAAVLGVELVRLLHRHPGELTPLIGDLLAELRVLGLELCQLVAAACQPSRVPIFCSGILRLLGRFVFSVRASRCGLRFGAEGPWRDS
jgi:hypothetical protein